MSNRDMQGYAGVYINNGGLLGRKNNESEAAVI